MPRRAARDILTNTYNWTITDGGVVADTIPPVPDVTPLLDVTAACEVTTLTSPTATDNCAGSVTVTNDATLPITTQGTTVVTWTYDDGNDNTSTQTQNVVIDDVTAPTITCIGNQVIDLTVGQTEYKVVGTAFDPTATNDNCSVASTENDFNNTATLDAASLPIGTTTITWTVTDVKGNTADCSFDVQVNAYVDGIDTISENGILIYPNPATNQLTIEYEDVKIKNIVILDITGKAISNMTVRKAEQPQIIDVSNLTKGVYFIKLTTNNMSKFVRFIKN